MSNEDSCICGENVTGEILEKDRVRSSVEEEERIEAVKMNMTSKMQCV